MDANIFEGVQLVVWVSHLELFSLAYMSKHSLIRLKLVGVIKRRG